MRAFCGEKDSDKCETRSESQKSEGVGGGGGRHGWATPGAPPRSHDKTAQLTITDF